MVMDWFKVVFEWVVIEWVVFGLAAFGYVLRSNGSSV
ncbi:MAG: hypothetical protein ACI85K_001191 [Hyphomicrobiaceae bacterium]|jgi:hypothetical protein